MSKGNIMPPPKAEVEEGTSPASASVRTELLQQYGCGPIQFSGTADALFERHLVFDAVTDVAAADSRTQYEAAAHSVRDVVSQRWVRTGQT